MKIENIKPADIEKRSMEIIESEMGDTSHLNEGEKLVVKRVIHATADFEFLKNLKFSKNAVEQALKSLKNGAVIVTDTNMALSGISKAACRTLNCELYCFMADDDVAKTAKEKGITRAVASIDKAVKKFSDKNVIFAIGNAPTAVLRLCDHIDSGVISPSLVIGAPVGFVNVVQSKNVLMEKDVPYIVADGRKGGSTVAAAIVNALLYQVYDRMSGKIL